MTPSEQLKRSLANAQYAIAEADDDVSSAYRILRTLPRGTRLASTIERDATDRMIRASVSNGGPEGPYVSKWSSRPFFIIPWTKNGKHVFTVVPNGMQPDEGTPHLTLRDARMWMRDNGFQLKNLPRGTRLASIAAAVSPVEQDAVMRLIEKTGMPFPIDENSKPIVSARFANGRHNAYQKKIPLSLLVATQRDFDPSKVASMIGQDDKEPIDCLLWRGKYYVDDGHHRAMSARFNGEQTVNANVVEAR